MTHVIEHAASSRARCRGCGEKIARDELRFGEREPNAFGEGDMTLWFHPVCAAYKRPEPFLALLGDAEPENVEAAEMAIAHALKPVAELGLEYHRLPRIDKVDRAPTARARCRCCRELIAKDSWRIGLVFFEEYRFEASGFIHAGCAGEYFGTTDVMERIGHFNPALGTDELGEIKADEVFAALDCKASVRAEELSLPQWVRLSNLLDPHPCGDLPPSADEPLEVVTENDEVLELLPRREIHQQKLRHRAVHVFLQNKSGEIYMQLRSHRKDTHPGKWDSSASGHVDPGETYHDCAVRELWEELWIAPKGDLTRVARLSASAATDEEFIEVFLAETKGKIRVHGKEIDSGRWFSPEQIEEWIEKRPQDFATGCITCFRAWRAGLP